jgi:hypothetical protein
MLSSIDGPGIQNEDDWYRIDVPSNEKRLIVDVKFRHGFGNINVEIIDEWGGWIMDSWSSSDGEFIDWVLPSGGIYFIHILGDNWGNMYDFWWEYLSTDDWMEPNDSFLSAHKVDPKWYSDLKIVGFNDDWYKIHLNPGDFIEVEINYDNYWGDLHLELYDPSNNAEEGSYEDYGYQFISFEADQSGDWRIYVYRVTGSSNDDMWYMLNIHVNGDQMGVDPYEWNDQVEDAYDLSDEEGKSLSHIHGLAVQEYDDWYKIEVSYGFEHLIIDVRFDSFVDNLYLTLWDDNYNWITDNFSMSGDEAIDINIYLFRGIYYIQIHGDDDMEEYDLWWDDIRTDFRPDDSYEENDDAASAFDLSYYEGIHFGGIYGVALQYDDDWYEIFADSAHERLHVELTYDFEEGPIGIEIYNRHLSRVASNYTGEDNALINYPLPSNGTYYIRIFGDRSGNIYNVKWDTREDRSDDMIPGYDVILLIMAVFGVTTIIVLRWKRSRKNF